MHQAGSDSIVTIEVFWKLIKNGLISEKELIEDKNILFGISKGKDNNETINYIQINNGLNNSNYNTNNINNKVYLNLNNNMNNNLTYIHYGNNMYGMFANYCYPQNVVNGFCNNLGFNGIPMANFRNNVVQYY